LCAEEDGIVQHRSAWPGEPGWSVASWRWGRRAPAGPPKAEAGRRCRPAARAARRL